MDLGKHHETQAFSFSLLVDSELDPDEDGGEGQPWHGVGFTSPAPGDAHTFNTDIGVRNRTSLINIL